MSKKQHVKYRHQYGATGLAETDPHYKDPEAFTDAVEVEDIKVIQLLPEERKRLVKEKTTTIMEGIEFCQYPNGWRGWVANYPDGSKRYFCILPSGEACEQLPVKGTFINNSFWDKVERFFGVTPEMRATVDPKIDKVHAKMFLIGAAIATVLVGAIAWWIRSAVS